MINVTTIISVIFAIFYIVILSVIARIDQKQIKIEKRTAMAGIGLAILYIISNYIIKPESIKYGIIYLGIYIILIAVDTFITKRYAKNSYTIGILMLFCIMLQFCGIESFTYTLILTTLEILITLLIATIKQKTNGNKKVRLDNIPVGYFIIVNNIFVIIMMQILSIIR